MMKIAMMFRRKLTLFFRNFLSWSSTMSMFDLPTTCTTTHDRQRSQPKPFCEAPYDVVVDALDLMLLLDDLGRKQREQLGDLAQPEPRLVNASHRGYDGVWNQLGLGLPDSARVRIKVGQQ